MTITSRKWDRLANGMRRRVGTAGKTASSRGERRSGHRPIEGCGGSANNRHDRQGTERNSLYLHSANGREWAIGSGAMGFLIWAFRWIAAASMAHPDLRLCPQKRPLNGYQMPSEDGPATNPATMTAAERKRRQRNLLPHLKIFLEKRLTQKGYPLSGTEPFLDSFLSEGA
jgi:hypothetical protein